ETPVFLKQVQHARRQLLGDATDARQLPADESPVQVDCSSHSLTLRQMRELSKARIAVVHDWLIDYAGSERALAEILRCFPRADLFSLVDLMPDAERAPLAGKRARTTFMQHLPRAASWLTYYLPLMPIAIEQLDVTGYDLVISSSHAVAKGVIVSPDALHVSYVYSPMRYAWDQQFSYLGGMSGPKAA